MVPFLKEVVEASLFYFFENWLMKLKCPKPQKYTDRDTFILIKKWLLVGLRGLQSMTNPVERPCKKAFIEF
jgi:hypothetical protein